MQCNSGDRLYSAHVQARGSTERGQLLTAIVARKPHLRIEKWITDALKSVERDGTLPEQPRIKLTPRQSTVSQMCMDSLNS